MEIMTLLILGAMLAMIPLAWKRYDRSQTEHRNVNDNHFSQHRDEHDYCESAYDQLIRNWKDE